MDAPQIEFMYTAWVKFVFDSYKNAHKCEWKWAEQAKTELHNTLNSTWSLNGAQNILNLNVKSLELNQHTAAHKSLWADYIYVTSERAKK